MVTWEITCCLLHPLLGQGCLALVWAAPADVLLKGSSGLDTCLRAEVTRSGISLVRNAVAFVSCHLLTDTFYFQSNQNGIRQKVCRLSGPSKHSA